MMPRKDRGCWWRAPHGAGTSLGIARDHASRRLPCRDNSEDTSLHLALISRTRASRQPELAHAHAEVFRLLRIVAQRLLHHFGERAPGTRPVARVEEDFEAAVDVAGGDHFGRRLDSVPAERRGPGGGQRFPQSCLLAPFAGRAVGNEESEIWLAVPVEIASQIERIDSVAELKLRCHELHRPRAVVHLSPRLVLVEAEVDERSREVARLRHAADRRPANGVGVRVRIAEIRFGCSC